MNLLTWPLIESLKDSERILLAGAGGGFDLYSGIPLYFMLKAMGKEVILANLSFAQLPKNEEVRFTESCVEVTNSFPDNNSYFPELHLCQWFKERHNEDLSIYAFPQVGVEPVREAYDKIQKKHSIDTVILIDGGTDSLMRGDEVGLGTPVEDIVSIAAAGACDFDKKFLVCIGFGIDSYHGVCHAHYLEAIADLTSNGGYLGVSTVLPQMDETKEFLSAVDFANSKTPRRESIVQNSIASALEGKYGDYHRTERTSGSEQWINPLMPIYWAFDLDKVIERNLYINSILHTQTFHEVATAIRRFRSQIGIRKWKKIPV